VPNFYGSKPVSPCVDQQVAKCFTARIALNMSSLGLISSMYGIFTWVFPKIGVPPKWMVYIGKPY